MPFLIVQGDITEMKVDAIVNAANNSLLGGGGVDGCIHRAAGPDLVKECAALNGCATGDAKITGAYCLPCRHVIHTVGPIWRGGQRREEELLTSCYKRSLQLAVEHNCSSVAFPLISAGVYGYPKDQALRVAEETIVEFLKDHELDVYLVIYSRRDFIPERGEFGELGRVLASETERYEDEPDAAESEDNAAYEVEEERSAAYRNAVLSDSREADAPWRSDSAETEPSAEAAAEYRRCEEASRAVEICQPAPEAPAFGAAPSSVPRRRQRAPIRQLDEALNHLDESFSQMLLRKIDEKGLTDVACYKKANLDRKLFSRIRSDADYRPSKPTAAALIFALELTLDEAKEMLAKAGFALSRSNAFDVIIEYFITKRIYDVYEVNKALFYYDQRLLGSK